MVSTQFSFTSASLIVFSFLLFSFPQPSASSTAPRPSASSIAPTPSASSIAPTPSASSTALIDSVCQKTPGEYTEFCFKTLSGDARALAATDAVTMTKVVCVIGEEFAKQAKKFFVAERKNASLSRALKKALTVCARYFNPVIFQFQIAPNDGYTGGLDIAIITDYTQKCTERLDEANDGSLKVKEIYDRVNSTLMYREIALAATP